MNNRCHNRAHSCMLGFCHWGRRPLSPSLSLSIVVNIAVAVIMCPSCREFKVQSCRVTDEPDFPRM